MSWSHRVVRRQYPSGEVSFALHEVYYDDAGEPTACTEGAVAPFGESLGELRRDLERMLSALDQPVLHLSEIGTPAVTT